MEVQKDFKELLELLNEHSVKYLVVGGYALAFHGTPRFTGDLDIFIKADKANAKRIVSALNEFGFGCLDLTTDDFIKPGMVVQLGVPPVRVDLITSITGVPWEQAYKNRIRGKYSDVTVNYISRDDLIANKRATARKKDIADVEALGEE